MMRNFDAGEWSLTDCEEKKYDAKKTASFSDDLTRDFQEYKDRANALEAGYGRYYHNDTYVGRNARDSKEFIGTRQTEEIHYENLDIQKEFLYAVAYIEDAFKEMVDPSPNAKIDSAVLEEIKHEQKAFAKVYDEEGYELECWARRMVDNFGRFGVSTRPSCAVIRDRYEELCGTGGHIDKCNKKLKEFDDFALNYLKKAGLKERSYKLQGLIKNTAGKLDLFSVYQPTMTNNSISLVALNSLPFKEFMARQMYSINTKIQNTEDVIGIKEFLDKNGIKVNKWISKKDGYFLIDKPISEILRDAGVDTETLDYKSYDDWYITGIPREDGTIAYSIIKIREPMDEQGAKAIAVPFNSLKISNLEKIISDAKAGNPIDEQALNGFRSDITKLSQADNYFNEYDEDILEYFNDPKSCGSYLIAEFAIHKLAHEEVFKDGGTYELPFAYDDFDGYGGKETLDRLEEAGVYNKSENTITISNPDSLTPDERTALLLIQTGDRDQYAYAAENQYHAWAYKDALHAPKKDSAIKSDAGVGESKGLPYEKKFKTPTGKLYKEQYEIHHKG